MPSDMRMTSLRISFSSTSLSSAASMSPIPMTGSGMGALGAAADIVGEGDAHPAIEPDVDSVQIVVLAQMERQRPELLGPPGTLERRHLIAQHVVGRLDGAGAQHFGVDA